MTSRRRSLPRSRLPRPYPGDLLRADEIRALSDGVIQGWQIEGSEVIRPFDVICILDEDLPRAENSKSPSKALATILLWDYDAEEYREPADYIGENQQLTDREIAENQQLVYNFSEDKDYDEDTFGIGIWREPHHWFNGDCRAMAERRAPSQQEEE